MWSSVTYLWGQLTGLFAWMVARKDVQDDKQRTDFDKVTGGYDKLATTLQIRIEGLIKEITDLKIKADQTDKAQEAKMEEMRRDYEDKWLTQNESNVKISKQLRACRSRETVMGLRVENMTRELSAAREELKSLKKRMDDHDSGEMKGIH